MSKSNEARNYWVKAEGNQLDTTVYATKMPDDCIDITRPGEDRWIATIIQTVSPLNNPHAMKAKWINVIEKSYADELQRKLDVAVGALEFYQLRGRYEWTSNGGLIGESLIIDNGRRAREALAEIKEENK